MSPSKSQRPLKPRGQALLLSALGMILLTLMVTMTLSFGTKAKQKMEVQIAADQAAYSTAVAAARTFNVLSMTNRVMIAHMTAMLGIQAAISFTTTWFMIVQTMLVYYIAEIANQLTCCNWGCAFFGCFTAAYVAITRLVPTAREFTRLMTQFPRRDRAAAAQARQTGRANMWLWGGQLATVSSQLYRALDNQGTARRVVQRASAGSNQWVVPAGGDKVAKREAGFVFGSPVALGFQGAIGQSNLIFYDRHAVYASMGSRGHFFTADRSTWFLPNGVNNMLTAAFRRIGAGSDIQRPGYTTMGHSQFGNLPHDDAILGTTTSRMAMADDHGFGIIRRTGPAARRPLTWPLVAIAGIISNNGTGTHAGLGSPGFWMDALHQVSAICAMNCPSAWTNFADFNPIFVGYPNDNFMQPKFPVTVYKDASLATPDPFNLMFNFRFNASGPGKTFDTRHGAGPGGGALMVRDGAGTVNISRQMGYSTGLTYYHRRAHWAEPPNLFNAFWRAGVTRADVDRAAGGVSLGPLPLSPDNSHDIEDTLRDSGADWAADAYETLYRIPGRYQGISP